MRFQCELDSKDSGKKLKLMSVEGNAGIDQYKIVLSFDGNCVVVSPSELVDAVRRITGLGSL